MAQSINTNSSTNNSETSGDSNVRSSVSLEEKVCLILLYTIILLLAIVGNTLVIITLAINKRMRTVTNVFLMNLAISDLLLGVFCMPFTLAGALLREFIFGEAMCRLIPYFQAVSVSVSAWTLVAMSVERYYAICHPLKSREWQTLSHANRMILVVWAGSLLCMLPVSVLSELQPIRDSDKYKCRESWPTVTAERLFNILLDALLLVVPLFIMVVTYSLITATLWKTMWPHIKFEQGDANETSIRSRKSSDRKVPHNILVRVNLNSPSSSSSVLTTDVRRTDISSVQTVTNMDRSLSQKKRVIKMLFVVVLEFFLCWTPIYVLNTITLFDPVAIYQGLGYYGISFFHLLAYTSSCCNPITYCFMNSKFRGSFMALFGYKSKEWKFRSDGSLSATLRCAAKLKV
ncbi:cholecystokinin receptor-like [Limulus polyphemus]|uniref:Gastrin/cholecystokinin type B receptor n=1 Tax=Limulus polyphemus TaxID=6850 RepID=A0ABM1TML5_LIMPO|nr:cholecystokinin receptor-like [Limulus polyphemus]